MLPQAEPTPDPVQLGEPEAVRHRRAAPEQLPARSSAPRWENRDSAGYAWRILSEGVCDGCALGTTGLQRLDDRRRPPLQRPPAAAAAEHDGRRSTRRCSPTSRALRELRGAELRALGRLPHPMLRRARRARLHAGSPGTRRSTSIAERIARRRPRPARLLPDQPRDAERDLLRGPEGGRARSARTRSTTPRASATRRAPSRSRRRSASAPRPAPTRDWIGTDLIVFIGSNVANNQPVDDEVPAPREEGGHEGRRRQPLPRAGHGALLDPVDAGERRCSARRSPTASSRSTSAATSASSPARSRHMIERGWVDRELRRRAHDRLRRARAPSCAAADWETLEAARGHDPRARWSSSREMLGEAERAVLVWSMGVTQHARGEDNVRAIVNLALARGFVGREGCGLMPIRGHSGVQGGAEMGCYATAFPGGVPSRRRERRPSSARSGASRSRPSPGLTAPEMIDAAGARRARRALRRRRQLPRGPARPGLGRARRSARIPLRVHMDIVLSAQMLVEPGRGRCCCCRRRPATRSPAGSPRRSTERRVDPQPRDPRARGSARRGRSGRCSASSPRACGPSSPTAVRFAGTAGDPRARSRAVVPLYARDRGAARGRRLVPVRRRRTSARAGEFPTADGRAHFAAVDAARAGRRRRPLRALDPPRQAVQLDGPGAQRRAHRRRRARRS